MTCIIGYIAKDGVYMGGDRAVTNEYEALILKHPKIFRKDHMIIGTCGTMRTNQLIQYSLKTPKYSPKEDPMSYLVNQFIPKLKEIFSGEKFDDDQDCDYMMIGLENRLFVIETNFQVIESADNFAVIGSGAPWAAGSMFTSTIKNPIKKMTKALEVSAYFCPGVKSPFDFLKL